MRDKYKTISFLPITKKESNPVNPELDNRAVTDIIRQILDWIINATRTREIDLLDYQNQIAANPTIFQTVPTSSSDLNDAAKFGDIAVGADSGTEYLYVVVNNGGTKQWQRVALSTF